MNNNQERKVTISGGVAENRKNERGQVGRCIHVTTPLPRDHALFFGFPLYRRVLLLRMTQ